jgi:hypothetical protein
MNSTTQHPDESYRDLNRVPKVGDRVWADNFNLEAEVTAVRFEPAPEDPGAMEDQWYCDIVFDDGGDDGDSWYWLNPLEPSDA